MTLIFLNQILTQIGAIPLVLQFTFQLMLLVEITIFGKASKMPTK